MKLSIIIPVYNTNTKFLNECLESIINSKILYEYEIIIINDGSTNEETLAFINNINNNHTKVINKQNGGVSVARNTGIKEAKGDYILFLDSDDILLEQINNAIGFLEKNQNFGLVYSDTIYFGDQKYYYKKGNFSKFRLIYLGNFLNVTTLIRSSIAKKYLFDENLKYGEDYDYWCKILNDGYKFKYLEKPFFIYRRVLDGNSLSQINVQNKQLINNIVKSKFDTNKEITKESINEYVYYNFKDNKKLLLKLISRSLNHL